MKHNRKLVFICLGSDCKDSGAKKLCKSLKDALDEAPLRGSCKIIKTKCMDMCKTAPNVIVGDHFCKKTSLDKVLEQIKKS
ncbi:(2Fe-2S) ferredoxin domain-containing protein [Algoriphagus sp. NG3]|uniref:(2Fe-2S) ferredoxin domain-containing protein n=1 Tax=unclassified Algoriphagus TaxID=2641541 RepID=UPI002A814ED9|nr:(2Fe-2S) ferredoxin domain-containing protein [Algoriphagus sp. NG3]WPR77583.1 (2Fe-2S) ferredoxin domain-containing protein [Algoriphagus sp. NG3]